MYFLPFFNVYIVFIRTAKKIFPVFIRKLGLPNEPTLIVCATFVLAIGKICAGPGAKMANFSKYSKFSIFGTFLRQHFDKGAKICAGKCREVKSAKIHFCRTLRIWVLWRHLVSDHNTHFIMRKAKREFSYR